MDSVGVIIIASIHHMKFLHLDESGIIILCYVHTTHTSNTASPQIEYIFLSKKKNTSTLFKTSHFDSILEHALFF